MTALTVRFSVATFKRRFLAKRPTNERKMAGYFFVLVEDSISVDSTPDASSPPFAPNEKEAFFGENTTPGGWPANGFSSRLVNEDHIFLGHKTLLKFEWQ